jgi:hypothetical protein
MRSLRFEALQERQGSAPTTKEKPGKSYQRCRKQPVPRVVSLANQVVSIYGKASSVIRASAFDFYWEKCPSRVTSDSRQSGFSAIVCKHIRMASQRQHLYSARLGKNHERSPYSHQSSLAAGDLQMCTTQFSQPQESCSLAKVVEPPVALLLSFWISSLDPRYAW